MYTHGDAAQVQSSHLRADGRAGRGTEVRHGGVIPLPVEESQGVRYSNYFFLLPKVFARKL